MVKYDWSIEAIPNIRISCHIDLWDYNHIPQAKMQLLEGICLELIDS